MWQTQEDSESWRMDVKQVSARRQDDGRSFLMLCPPSLKLLCLPHPPSLLQILIIALFIVPVWMCRMNRCYNESELSEAATRKLRVHYHQPPDPSPAADPDSLSSCPLELYQHLAPQDETKRSLSPWRYV